MVGVPGKQRKGTLWLEAFLMLWRILSIKKYRIQRELTTPSVLISDVASPHNDIVVVQFFDEGWIGKCCTAEEFLSQTTMGLEEVIPFESWDIVVLFTNKDDTAYLGFTLASSKHLLVRADSELWQKLPSIFCVPSSIG